MDSLPDQPPSRKVNPNDCPSGPEADLTSRTKFVDKYFKVFEREVEEHLAAVKVGPDDRKTSDAVKTASAKLRELSAAFDALFAEAKSEAAGKTTFGTPADLAATVTNKLAELAAALRDYAPK